jgi:hypothetical protein
VKKAKTNISCAAGEALFGEASRSEPIGEGADWMHARARAHLLGDAPITMILAVLEPAVTVQKGLGHSAGRDFTSTNETLKRA